MRKSMVIAVISAVTLLVGLGTAQHVAGQAVAATYPTMSSADTYLMADRSAEVALARTAAPESMSHDAEVLVLGLHGFDVAVDGKNGFVCKTTLKFRLAKSAEIAVVSPKADHKRT